MAGPAPRRKAPDGPVATPGGRRQPPAGPGPTDEVYARGVIEFLDKRWTRAEADFRTALRSMLLLCGTTIGCSALIVSLAVAAAGVTFLIMFAQEQFLGPDPGPTGLALFIAVAGVLIVLRGLMRRWASRDP